jgi:hypothetical protein
MRIGSIVALTLGLAIAGSAHASIFVVQAQANSSSGGSGLASIALTAGEVFSVNSSLEDTWSAGSLPRVADGNGLDQVRFSDGTDDSGFATGTQLTAIFPLYTQHGLTTNYASLVGEIGGIYQELGANFVGAAWGTGTLNLYFWDENNGDNYGNIAFDIKPRVSVDHGPGDGVPEPASWALMITGFGAAGAMLRAKRTSAFA